ncbi:putative permease [Marinomonas spartinae]|uniref:Putative permease n=1 Tax=Marinomonas spartinae TaxID=1792290 RepID=A0A1A8TS62_9GAMM|nr:SO_0444 family Cu/Zn efflux transporter [Marinomonas spartinae]SBS37507.1 putative permease [Marinomonas spartinae]
MIFLEHFYVLFLESAPWLLIGLVLAGMLKMFVSMSWMTTQLGGHDLKTTIKAALFGAPLPLCSCGVIPAAVGLRRAGASKAATTSFLVSTPETGVDSISVSYVLLGPFMAIVRPIAAVCSAIIAGVLVGKDEGEVKDRQTLSIPKTCCAGQKQEVNTNGCSSKTQATSSCCGQGHDGKQEPSSIVGKIRSGLVYSATELLDDTALWLLIGLGFAALVQAYLPDGFLAQWGNGLLAMLVMVIVSIPMYICATASTPIAAGLLLAGVSPGAVLVFMMAGPATNIATLGVVSKELGKRALMGYLTGVLGGALFFGYLVDLAVTQFNIQVMPQLGQEEALLPSWLTLSTSALLALLIALSLGKQIKKQVISSYDDHKHT